MAVKFTLAALAALLSKVLPKALLNRALYKLTGRKVVWLLSALVMLGVTLWLSPVSADTGSAASEEAPERSAAVTCAVVDEMHSFQRADAIREINDLRSAIGEEPFLDGYKTLTRATDAGLCVALALNQDGWREELENSVGEKTIEAETDAQLEAEVFAEESLDSIESEGDTESVDWAIEREKVDIAAAWIQRAVVSNWRPPESARASKDMRLEINLLPSGEVVGVRVSESSGSVALDRSAINAVEREAIFPSVADVHPVLYEKHLKRFELIFKP